MPPCILDLSATMPPNLREKSSVAGVLIAKSAIILIVISGIYSGLIVIC